MCGELAEVQTSQKLGFGTARIHFGHRFSWPGCSSERNDLAPGIPSCPNSPHTQPQGLSWIQSPAEPLGDTHSDLSRRLKAAGGSFWSHPSQGMVALPGDSGVAAGVGRLWSAWHQAAPGTLNHPMEVAPSAFPLPDLAQREGERGSRKNSPF